MSHPRARRDAPLGLRRGLVEVVLHEAGDAVRLVVADAVLEARALAASLPDGRRPGRRSSGPGRRSGSAPRARRSALPPAAASIEPGRRRALASCGAAARRPRPTAALEGGALRVARVDRDLHRRASHLARVVVGEREARSARDLLAVDGPLELEPGRPAGPRARTLAASRSASARGARAWFRDAAPP